MLIISLYLYIYMCVCGLSQLHNPFWCTCCYFWGFFEKHVGYFLWYFAPRRTSALRSREAEETIVMKHALRNTTALLRGLAAGNLSDTASLLSGAYAEISSISSWLLGSRPTGARDDAKRIKQQQQQQQQFQSSWARRCQKLYFIDPDSLLLHLH